MTALVTGAGGFIGSHLVEALLEEGPVRALVHYDALGGWGNLEQLRSAHDRNLEVVLGDITDPYAVRKVVDGCEVVFHLAALIGIPYSYVAPASYVATNVQGTLHVLQASMEAKVRRIIVTSTSEVYGTAQYSPIDEEHPLRAQSPYSASKIGADKLAEAYFNSFDLPVTTLRPFNTFGPRQSSRAVIPTILTQALAGADTINLGNLAPARDLVFVHDTVRAFQSAAKAPDIEGEVIHFGSGRAESVESIARLCLAATENRATLVSAPERMRPERSEVGLLICDYSKAERLLGWRPSVSLEVGLRRTMDYIKQHADAYDADRYGL